MNFTKLNQKGVAHHFAIALVVVGIVSAFAFQQVAGSAMTESNASTSLANPNNCKGRPTVKYPQHNACAAKVQHLLGGLTIDGQFGKKTRAAVKTLQERKGLNKDGIVGACTWKALYGEVIPAKCKNGSKNTVTSHAAVKPTTIGSCTYHMKGIPAEDTRGQKMTKAACDAKKGTFTAGTSTKKASTPAPSTSSSRNITL